MDLRTGAVSRPASGRTLVFFGAHPDDETFGLGATLAQYAAAGVKVYYACATRGEAGSTDPENMKGFASMGDLRWHELECAAKELGLAGVVYLGYRDSGMPGTPDNTHPLALAAAPVDQVTGRMVKVIRELKPQVALTFDPIGGYRHPDHVAVHNAAVRAFEAAADPGSYPEAGAPHRAQKLYFPVFSHRALRLMVRLMPLFGRDPRRSGRNKDIDLTAIASIDFPVHAVIRLTKAAMAVRDRASDCHASQLGGRPPPGGLLRLFDTFSGTRDYFMRAYPPPGKRRERDLFEGVA